MSNWKIKLKRYFDDLNEKSSSEKRDGFIDLIDFRSFILLILILLFSHLGF